MDQMPKTKATNPKKRKKKKTPKERSKSNPQ
jgi:hypothetical protein